MAPRCRLPFIVILIFVFSNNSSASFTSGGFTIKQHLLASGLQPNFGPKLHKAFHHFLILLSDPTADKSSANASFVCSEIFLLVPITLLAVLSRLRTFPLLSDHLDLCLLLMLFQHQLLHEVGMVSLAVVNVS